MKQSELHRFQDIEHFNGWVWFDEVSILALEAKVKEIRVAFEAVKNG